MIYVILKDRRVLQYNTATHFKWTSTLIELDGGKDGAFGIARIPSNLVERIEATKPCKITKLRNKSSSVY